jgi:Aspartyl/Asparaginyl beta-hydroxylase
MRRISDSRCSRLLVVSKGTSRSMSTPKVTSFIPPIMANVLQGPSMLHTTLHRSSPTLMLLPGLRALPFWTCGTTHRVAYQDPTVQRIVQHLEAATATIQAEYADQQQRVFSDYDVTSRGGEHALDSLHTGTWDWHSYMLKGRVQGHFVQHFPQTAAVLQHLRDEGHLFEGTPFGFSFISKLHGHATIRAHTSPINFRLRIHLPLIVPAAGDVGIRVGPATQRWTEGKAMVLDDSYEHEVWNKTKEARVLLLVDVWHPDVTTLEREQILNMFGHAQQQGWLGAKPAE